MGDFKLDTKVDIKYNEETDSYVFGHFDPSKIKKVTSRAFSCLLGQNHFESIGKTILERTKLTIYEPIDEYWGVRGDIAELLVQDYLKASYKQNGIDLTLKTWLKESVGYDNFKKNPDFGGLIDIAIVTPEKFRAVVEVKSKSMKDFDKIKENRGNIEEVLQGKFLMRLSNVDKCLMAYVFFTPDQESAIRTYVQEKDQDYPGMNFAKLIIAKMGMDYNSVKIQMFKHTIDNMKQFDADMIACKDILENFKTTKSIPSNLFSDNEIQYLKGLTGQDDGPF